MPWQVKCKIMVSVETVEHRLTVVVPCRSVTQRLENLLATLLAANCEIIVVQAQHESDVTMESCGPARFTAQGVCWLFAAASRGGQIAAGIARARADLIWVLHADSQNIAKSLAFLLQLGRSERVVWGRFDVQIEGTHLGLVVVALAMNWRSRLTRICTGDQGIFFHLTLLQSIGGFPAQPLMEDIELCKRLKRLTPRSDFLASTVCISTSGQRWQRQGFCITVLAMWKWRLRYFFGASPQHLFQEYYRDQRRAKQ
ncbi:MAG: glycosyl transferase [Proteobacteria bacterium]|nr:glycosyl transferase [Pseudomonadota bacterium]